MQVKGGNSISDSNSLHHFAINAVYVHQGDQTNYWKWKKNTSIQSIKKKNPEQKLQAVAGLGCYILTCGGAF